MENKLTETQKIEFSHNVGPGELYGLEQEIILSMLTIADLYRQQRYQEMGQMLKIKAHLLKVQAELTQTTAIELMLQNLMAELPATPPIGFKIGDNRKTPKSGASK